MAKTAFRVLSYLTQLLATISAAVLIILIFWKLLKFNSDNFTDDPTTASLQNSTTCLLSTDTSSLRPCIYGVSIGAVALILTTILGCLTCLTCGCCGAGKIFGVVLAGGLTAWFGIGAGVLIPKAVKANSAGLLEKDARIGVIAALIGGVVFNGLGVLVEIGKLF